MENLAENGEVQETPRGDADASSGENSRENDGRGGIPTTIELRPTDDSPTLNSYEEFEGGVVGVDLSGTFKDDDAEFHEAIANRKYHLETQLSKLLRFGTISHGAPEMSIEKFVENGKERMISRLECEIDLHQDLRHGEYRRMKEICRKVSNLIKTAGATREDLEQIMIGTMWKRDRY